MAELCARERLKLMDTEGLRAKEVADRLGVCHQRVYQLRNSNKPSNKTPITKRQMEVLKLICDGNGNDEIAEALGLAIKTIHGHREALYAKLDAHNVAQVIMAAVRRGLVEV